MTPPTQDDLAAGRELDALVAEKVMGCAVERRERPVFGAFCRCVNELHWQSDLSAGVPRYSTDIAAAWTVAEWAEASPRGWKLTLMRSGRSLPDYQWVCTFHRGHVELARVVEREAPVAICKTALQAVSV